MEYLGHLLLQLQNFCLVHLNSFTLFGKVLFLLIDFIPELNKRPLWVFIYLLKFSVCIFVFFSTAILNSLSLNHSLPCLWVWFLETFHFLSVLPCYLGYSWYLMDCFSAWAFEVGNSLLSTTVLLLTLQVDKHRSFLCFPVDGAIAQLFVFSYLYYWYLRDLMG